MADSIPTSQQVPLSSLTPAPWNPRTISDERFTNLCRSLESDPDFLRLRPILATTDGTIFAGNMRYRAAQHLGWETVPAILVDIPEQLARERALRDNAQWGEWQEDDLAGLLQRLDQEGSDLGLLGFEDRELRDLLNRLEHEGGLTDPDAVPDLPEESITRPGDLWLLGDHRVLCGDATNPHDVAIVMAGEQAKLMATDPPYLVNYVGGNHPPSASNRPEVRDKHWDDYKDPESAVGFYVAFLEAAFPHLVERAPVYQWHANTRQSLVDEAWRKAGLLAHQVIIWVKTRGVLTRSHFMWQHEPCMYGWVEGRMPKLKPPANETTVWHVDQKGEQGGIHPTQKPVELFRRPLNWHTKPGDLCYEPFLGSGTCLIAAEQLGRRCYGMEQEPAYVDVVVRRWEEYTGRKAERITAGDEEARLVEPGSEVVA
ncbi:DNA modification methylase [bacterium]|nr:DNA modification methylase [bacterium]